MAIMNPADIPIGRDHLDGPDRRRLARLERLVHRGLLHDAQEVAEDLWSEATDAHKELYHGLSNALTAACAAASGQTRGALQIARRARQMLAPYPRRAVGLDLESLIDSLRRFLEDGGGPILL
jgi:hypothetical protein